MYAELFKKLGLRRDKLCPYEGFDLQAFNDMVARSWGYIKFMVTLIEGRNIRTINLQLLVILYRSVYNYILGKPFTTMMYVMTSLVHLKLKYHNVHEVLVTMCADLSRS